MKKLYYSLLFICLAFITIKPAYADHVAGGEITYKCTTTPGVWEITFVYYRDCNGIPLCFGSCGAACSINLQLFGADPSCNNIQLGTITCTLDNVRDVDINPTCPTSKNVCANMGCSTPGTFNPSHERYEFKGLVNLGSTSGIASSCCNVRLVWEECCRGAIATGAIWERLYIESTINRCLSLSPCNSSPELTNDPYVVICAGQNFVYNNGATELDRDSLSFEFTPALKAFNSSVTYNSPFAYDKPMPWTGAWNGTFPAGIRCDPQTGDIMFTPGNSSGSYFYGVVAVGVKQWKTISGVPTLMGITRRDIQMSVSPNCAPNNPPILKTIPTNSSNPNLPKTSWETCEGSQLCFDVLANDTDSISTTIMDSTYLSWDSSIASLGATFTPNYVPGAKPRKDSYKFCWTPPVGTASTIPYLFTIKAIDSKCPIPGRVIRGFRVKVLSAPTAVINKTTAGCSKWGLNYTNAKPAIPISSVSWKVAKAPFDYTFVAGADTFGNITATPFKQYAQPGKYLIQLTLNSTICSYIQYDTLFVGTTLQPNASNDTVICSGSSITLNAMAQNGIAPYMYRWFNSISDTALTPLNSPGFTIPTYVATPSANKYYTLQVRDSAGCRSYDSVLVRLTKGVKDTAIKHVRCFAQSNGSIAINMLDTLMTYQYKLDNGSFQLANLFTGLSVGTYSITTKDTQNCTTTTNNISITQPALLRDTLTSVTNETCKGLNNGALTTLALGGKTPYRYSIDSITFGATRVFTNLVPATYTVHILDTNNCYATTSRTITAADSFYAATTTTNPTCFSANNGEIRTQGIGGKAPYTYRLGTTGVFNNDSVFENVTANTYTINIKDNNNCVVTFTQTLTQPTQIVNTLQTANVTCFAANNGSVTIRTTGGVKPYTYRNGTSGSVTSDSVFGNLAAGTYTFFVFDSIGCNKSFTHTITQPALLRDTLTTVTNETCKSLNNGTLTTLAFGGKTPYRYSIDSITFGATRVFTNLVPATYKIHILDSNNCYTTTTRTISPADSFYAATVTTNPTCFNGTNGEIRTQGIGGKAPYTYRLGTIGVFNNDSIFENLPANTYTINIKDNNNCVVTFTKTLTQPTQLSTTSEVVNGTCFATDDGSVTIHTTGGTKPYTFRNGTIGSITSDSVFRNLAAATYTFFVFDSGGCVNSFFRTITQPQQIVATVSQLNPTCNNRPDGSITITATQGKAPFTYALDAGLYSSTNTFTNLVGNTYSVSVKDSFGCKSPFAVVLPNPALITTGSITGNQLVTQNTVHTYSVPSQAGLNFVWAQQKGSIMSGKNTPTVTINWDSVGTGIVGVAVYSDTTCGDTVSIPINIGANSLAEIASLLGLEIYPNPSTGIINITLQTLPTNRILKLYDIQGKLIVEQELKLSQQLNIERQPQGVYMLKIGEWHGQVVKE